MMLTVGDVRSQGDIWEKSDQTIGFMGTLTSGAATTVIHRFLEESTSFCIRNG